MIRLEEIAFGLALTGLEPAVIGSVVAVVPIAEGTVQAIYKTPDGALKDRLLNRFDESKIGVGTTERPWSFDGDGEAFKLAVEAKRINFIGHERCVGFPASKKSIPATFLSICCVRWLD